MQEESGSMDEQPRWKLEAEASMFAVDDFEKEDFGWTKKWFAYRPWTLTYIWNQGKRLMSSFRKKLKHIRDYFSEEELEKIS